VFVCKSLLVGVVLAAAGGVATEAANAATGPDSSAIASRIGWVDRCLAIENAAIEPGTPVTLLMFADDAHLIAQRLLTRRVVAKIAGKTTSGEKCPALIEDPRGGNQVENVSFYTLSVGDAPADPGVFGIGLVGLDPALNRIDLDGNGAADSFTVCRADHGFSFAAWSDQPRAGEPFWKAAFYTGTGQKEKDCIPDPEIGDNVDDEESPLAARIGWVDTCLAIEDEALKPGTSVTVVTFDSDADRNAPQKILKRRLSGKIVSKTTSANKCPALKGERQETNQFSDVYFYTLALDGVHAGAPIVGVGIVGLDAKDIDHIDLDGDGVADSFTACPTFKYINFAAWTGAPHENASLWDANDYLGREAEGAECPFTNSIAEPAGPPTFWAPEFRLGWVYGGCLGIMNTVLQPGTPLAITAFSDDDARASGGTGAPGSVSAKIVGKLASDKDCPELAKNVKTWDAPEHLGFYKLALNGGRDFGPGALGIGVIQAGDGPIDLDQSGAPDGFTICSAGEGIGYIAWTGEPPDKPTGNDLLWVSSPFALRHQVKGLKQCPELQ